MQAHFRKRRRARHLVSRSSLAPGLNGQFRIGAPRRHLENPVHRAQRHRSGQRCTGPTVGQFDRLGRQFNRSGEVERRAHTTGQPSCAGHTLIQRHAFAVALHLAHPLDSLVHVLRCPPECFHPVDQTRQQVRLVVDQTPVGGGAQVVELAPPVAQALDRARHRSSGVAPASRDTSRGAAAYRLGFPGRGQLVRAYCARSRAGGSASGRRLVRLPTSDLSTRRASRSSTSACVDAAAAAHRLGRLQRQAAGEDRQAPEQRPLGR